MEKTPPPSRRVLPEKVKVDKEIDGLLSSINCQYVKWRLAQKLGVTSKSTFPILFNYRFPGSTTSELSSLCPTRNSYEVLCSILIDARANHQVNQIAMSKAILIVKPDGSEVDVSKWLKPLNDREERSNRPKIIVVETETHLLFSLAADQQGVADMEESLNEMSIGREADFDMSISSGGFHPEYESSPLPRKPPFMWAMATKKAEVLATVDAEAGEGIQDSTGEGVQDQSTLSDFFGFAAEPDQPSPYANLSDLVDYRSETELDSDTEVDLLVNLCGPGRLSAEQGLHVLSMCQQAVKPKDLLEATAGQAILPVDAVQVQPPPRDAYDGEVRMMADLPTVSSANVGLEETVLHEGSGGPVGRGGQERMVEQLDLVGQEDMVD